MNYPKYVSSKPSWINLHSTQRDELLPLLPTPGTWLVVPGGQLPSVFPDTFRAKIDSALIISVPTSTGGTYLVFSNHRVDRPASAIDIEPFGLIVQATSGPSASGVYIHHQRRPRAFGARSAEVASATSICRCLQAGAMRERWTNCRAETAGRLTRWSARCERVWTARSSRVGELSTCLGSRPPDS